MIWLLLALLARSYWPVPIAALPTSTHTHVQIEGRVVYVATEADGDLHFRIADAKGRTAICEIIPALPLAHPYVGQVVRVRGILRFDRAHLWYELHPVESWTVAR